MAAHALAGRLHVTSLQSYEHMGQMHIELEAGTWAAAACTGGAAIGNTTIDGLVAAADRVSISIVSELTFNVAPLRLPGACLRIRVAAVASTPPRAENKVKLFSFVLF